MDLQKERLIPKEGTVLEAEERTSQVRFQQYQWRGAQMGFLPRAVFGVLFFVVFALGLFFTLIGALGTFVFLLIRRLIR